MRNRILLWIFLLFLFSACASHRYLVVKSENPHKEETIHVRLFTLWWFVPVYADLKPAELCPNSKIRMINMHTSVLNGFVCGSTAFLICPHTVGVECE